MLLKISKLKILINDFKTKKAKTKKILALSLDTGSDWFDIFFLAFSSLCR